MSQANFIPTLRYRRRTRPVSHRLTILASVLIGCFYLSAIPRLVHATAIAGSNISFFDFQITATTGSVELFDLWTAAAFAQAQNSFGASDSQFDVSSGGTALAVASVLSPFAGGAGTASAENLTGSASSTAIIPGAIDAQALSAGHGTLFNLFMIVGGTGPVDVEFAVDIAGSMSVFTDAFGLLAETESIFSMELDGTPIFSELFQLSEGSNSIFPSTPFSKHLTFTMPLEFNTLYFLLAEADSESQVINSFVPEPSTITLLLGGIGLLGAFARYKRRQA